MTVTVFVEGKEAQRGLGILLNGLTSGERQNQQSDLNRSDSEAQSFPSQANLGVRDKESSICWEVPVKADIPVMGFVKDK